MNFHIWSQSVYQSNHSFLLLEKINIEKKNFNSCTQTTCLYLNHWKEKKFFRCVCRFDSWELNLETHASTFKILKNESKATIM